MKQTEFADRIFAFLNEQGISFSKYQAELCSEHILLMQEWNRRLNLTRITDVQEILVKHLSDSLIPTRWLPCRGSSLDIGTGAGFPGIPIKIAQPQLNVVLLEAQRKKVSFLKVVLAKLQLSGIYAVQARWEELVKSGDSGILQRHDLVTIRALRLNPDQLAFLAQSTLRREGTLAWWAGPSADNEAMLPYNTSLKRFGIEFEGCIPYHLSTKLRPGKICLWKKTS
ncbi:MAG: 16S rRNA (guanine(527)-N(7))-methyltransferase RsmG [Desulforhabdus sp.]|jgi:16S rRNA (guanine527-N7)-methyltransferase|nr:16S rRNA (guanine(527)-N(7))-methyltransferase RsmG [Desulforhabdus sp.]